MLLYAESLEKNGLGITRQVRNKPDHSTRMQVTVMVTNCSYSWMDRKLLSTLSTEQNSVSCVVSDTMHLQLSGTTLHKNEWEFEKLNFSFLQIEQKKILVMKQWSGISPVFYQERNCKEASWRNVQSQDQKAYSLLLPSKLSQNRLNTFSPKVSKHRMQWLGSVIWDINKNI